MKTTLRFNFTQQLIHIFFLIPLLFFGRAEAQTIGNYAGLANGTFTAASGTFSSISGTGSVINFTSNDDATAGSIPLGFTFIYMGVPYTTCFVNTNGYLSFSQIAPAINASYGPLNSAATNFHPALCAYLSDLQGSTNLGYFQTSGSAGSRVFTFELKEWGVFSYTNPASFFYAD